MRWHVYVTLEVTVFPLRKPLKSSLPWFPFGPLCTLTTGMALGNGPSKERYRGNYDHRPFAEAIEEFSPILLISCGHSVRHSIVLFIDFHEETLLVELNHGIITSAQ